MSVPANEIIAKPVSVEGLEEVFEAEDSPARDSNATEDRTTQDNANTVDSPAQDWTVSQASKALGISEKTVLRRLQRGTLAGYKVNGQFGPEWRITRAAQDSHTQDSRQAEDRTVPIVGEALDTPAQVIVIEELRQEIAGLRRQLEGAIYRNGYLEAKLEERDSTIKLLTDSQHKPGWWRRFCSWMMGQRQGS